MYILSFETTGILGSVALTGEDGETVMKVSSEKMSHLRKITVLADELLKENGIGKDEIGVVAASVGPGSFTGIRIGLATARTIAQILNVPCIGVSSLEIFREYACEGRSVAVIFNARRGQVYGAVYGEDKGEIMKPGPYMLTDVLEAIEGVDNIVFYGDGVDAYEEQLQGRNLSPVDSRYQTATMVAKVASRKYLNGETVSYEELIPEYMRMAEAEQKLKDGTLAELRKKKLERFRNA